MTQTFYASGFNMTQDPFGGVRLSFGVHIPAPAAPGQPAQAVSEEQVAIAMSLMHLKVMTYIIAKAVVTHEQKLGVITVPEELLRTPSMQISLDAWHQFWGRNPEGAMALIPGLNGVEAAGEQERPMDVRQRVLRD